MASHLVAVPLHDLFFVHRWGGSELSALFIGTYSYVLIEHSTSLEAPSPNNSHTGVWGLGLQHVTLGGTQPHEFGVGGLGLEHVNLGESQKYKFGMRA